MKNIITLGFILLLSLKSFAQTDGISYQAVIIGPDVLLSLQFLIREMLLNLLRCKQQLQMNLVELTLL